MLAILSLLLFPAMVFSQDQPLEKGSVEFGIRHLWDDEYGRPDLPFKPSFITSKFNEYGDRRNGVFIHKHLRVEHRFFEIVVGAGGCLRLSMERVERFAIQHALALCRGNRTKAAALLGISRDTLYRKLRQSKD